MVSIEPELWVEHAGSAARFYADAFNATVVLQVGEGDDVVTRLDVDGARFWVAAADPSMGRRAPGGTEGATARILLNVSDPVAVVAAAEAAGATVTAAVAEEHGWLLGRIIDPHGHEWEIGHHLGG